jgi:hypothetical protein
MSAFIVQLKNEPGQGAQVLQALADRGLNVMIAAAGYGDTAIATLVTDNNEAAKEALNGKGLSFSEVPIVKVRLRNQPGEGARLFGLLHQVGVNVELVLPIAIDPNQADLLIGTNDTDRAREVLSADLVE